jgi:hypothetical protein
VPEAVARYKLFWHKSLHMFFSRFRPWCDPIERRAFADSCDRPLGSMIFPLVCLILFCLTSMHGQESVVPTVTFAFDFPGSLPDHYVVSVSDDGRASYDSDGKFSPESAPGDPFHSDFTLSQATRVRVFDLAKRAHYFDGEIDSRKKVAFTGTKILTYKDAEKNTHASYNYASAPAIQELTALFQGLSNTLEFGYRLDYYLRHQKLALDDELKKMDEMSKNGELEEVSAVAPVLQKIADDPAVIKVVRARARRLLQLAETGSK